MPRHSHILAALAALTVFVTAGRLGPAEER